MQSICYELLFEITGRQREGAASHFLGGKLSCGDPGDVAEPGGISIDDGKPRITERSCKYRKYLGAAIVLEIDDGDAVFIKVVAKALGDAMNQMVIGRALHEKPAACEEYFATDPPSKCLQLLQFRVRDELLRCIGCLTQRGVDGLCVRASAVGDEEIAILVLGQSAGRVANVVEIGEQRAPSM